MQREGLALHHWQWLIFACIEVRLHGDFLVRDSYDCDWKIPIAYRLTETVDQ